MNDRSQPASLTEVFLVFLRLGCTSFGGPVAHLGYFHDECVQRRRWLDGAAYADLLALCQFLPGPASSQLVFALGRHRAGLAGALLASAAFILPSAILMLLFAGGLHRWGQHPDAGWLQGLKIAAVAVVAKAVWTMGRRLCPDLLRLALAAAAAAFVLLLATAWSQIAALLAGAAVGWIALQRAVVVATPASSPPRRSLFAGGGALLLWALLLFGLPLIPWSPDGAGAVFTGFYRAGSLVFGGGHVVLPMLREVVVPTGWTTDNVFLAGYGAAQAVPGPLFSFTACLGALLHAGPGGIVGGLWALFAIYLPAWLLIGGALPFWETLRALPALRAALAGANAAVVGILLAAFYQPVWLTAIHDWRDVALAVAAFLALHVWARPAWMVVIAAAVLGQLLLGS
ncbi:chromate efflux transporter [Horticoccus luteus]|uniref:Chromate efflux transporter n=1 Tax=Horticoccus luteus TaxID=2862869 RepID=A0A8F9TUY5_9BACT|nr:chromate efflux transporter [Horticoccus luteus]QYM78244.1 chromate efflux transporter [Horticoccus luteus]